MPDVERMRIGGVAAGGRMYVLLPSADQRMAMLLAALPLLLYVYLPRPPVPGSQFLAYPVLGGILGAVALLLLRERPVISPGLAGWFLVLLLYAITTGVSFFFNASELRGSAPIELFKPALFGIFLLYGYLVAERGSERAIERGLLGAAALVLLGQAVVAATQLVGIPFFGVLYNDDKSRAIGGLLRATGTLSNPNAFAWMVTQASVIVLLLARGRTRAWLLGLGTLLVLVSGSRTLLVLFPFMLVTAQVLRNPTSLGTYVRYAGLAAGLLLLFAGVIYYLGDYFPYLAQIELVVSSGSLASVSSFAIRLRMWESGIDEFVRAGWSAWLIGVGSRPSTAVLDSDYLYVFIRLGALGMLAHLAVIGAAAVRFYRSRRHLIAIIGGEYLLFALVFGIVAESLASWHLPLVLFALVGLTMGLDTASRRASTAPRRSPLRRPSG